MDVICILLTLYFFILLIKVFSGWFLAMARRPPVGALRQALQVVDALTDPVLRPVRRLLPPMAMGGMGLDLSPIIVFLVLGILQRSVC